MKTRLALLSLLLVVITVRGSKDVDPLVGQWKSNDGEVLQFKEDGTLFKGDEKGKWEVHEKGGLRITMPAYTTEVEYPLKGDKLHFDNKVYTRVVFNPFGGAPKPDARRDPKDLIASARASQRIGEWAMLIGFLFIAVALVYGAIAIFRKVLKISGQSTLTGGPAIGVAVGLLIGAVVLAVIGIVLFCGGRLF